MSNEWKEKRVEFYNEIYKNPDNHWRRELFFKFDELLTETILGNIKPYHKTMLEIGCDGRFFETFCKKKHNLNISVVDICPKAIKIIDSKFNHIKTFCEDFYKFSEDKIKEKKKYDIIFSCGTHEHFPDLNKALKLTKELLSDNGFFLMAVPNNLGYDINKNDQYESFRELNGGSRQTEWHLFLDSWKKHIEDAGFEYNFFKGFDERIGFIFYMYKSK